MDPIRNPYAPGAGRTPAALVGRDRSIRTWQIALQRIEAGRTERGVVLYGLRGVGKTVLLNRLRRDAEARHWIVAQVEAGTGKSLREAFASALHAPLADLARPTAGRRLLKALKTVTSFQASLSSEGAWTFGLDLTNVQGGGADSGSLEMDISKVLQDVSEAAREEGFGLAILIDEAQELSRAELTALCAAAHLTAQRDWACLVALAGLPSLPRVLAEAKSYAERLFTYASVGQLDDNAAALALTGPAAAQGVGWEPAAVDLLVSETAGYPYFLQQFGLEAWDEAAGVVITLADAQVAAVRGLAALDSGFFRSRWDRATRAEQRYLRAMAADGHAGSAAGEVAARMKRTQQSVGPLRAKLISKGLIYSPEHGTIAFTVPGMASFITRQPPET